MITSNLILISSLSTIPYFNNMVYLLIKVIAAIFLNHFFYLLLKFKLAILNNFYSSFLLTSIAIFSLLTQSWTSSNSLPQKNSSMLLRLVILNCYLNNNAFPYYLSNIEINMIFAFIYLNVFSHRSMFLQPTQQLGCNSNVLYFNNFIPLS